MNDDFVFTWPVTLFASFQIAIYHSAVRTSGDKRPDGLPSKTAVSSRKRWQDRFVGLDFFATCLGYFLLCRRLSLVTQWVFLCGFVGALPFLLVSRRLSRRAGRWNMVVELGLTLLGYLGFHVATTIMLGFKYELSPF